MSYTCWDTRTAPRSLLSLNAFNLTYLPNVFMFSYFFELIIGYLDKQFCEYDVMYYKSNTLAMDIYKDSNLMNRKPTRNCNIFHFHRDKRSFKKDILSKVLFNLMEICEQSWVSKDWKKGTSIVKCPLNCKMLNYKWKQNQLYSHQQLLI